MFETRLNTAVQPPRVELSGSLTVADAAQARQDLLNLIPRLPAGPLQIDAGQIEDVDGAGVQLLLATTRVLATAGRSVQWSAVSELLLRVSRTIGAADAAQCCGVPFGAGVPAC